MSLSDLSGWGSWAAGEEPDQAGHTLIVHDVVRASVDELVASSTGSRQSGADVASVARSSSRCCRRSGRRAAVLGQAAFSKSPEGCIVVDMSSISPMVSQKWARRALRRVEFLDAPVSGDKTIDGWRQSAGNRDLRLSSGNLAGDGFERANRSVGAGNVPSWRIRLWWRAI